jgi:LmbE family N-acetylglucosaminyl deacetylase
MVKIALIFEAHADDFTVGLGGTIIKLVKEGYSIIDIVFSAGQKSLPHYKEDIVIKKRIEESEGIGGQFGVKQHIFFGLQDNKLKEEIQNKGIKERLRRIIKKYSPKKIFLTSSTDPHPDHRAVNKAVIDVIDDLNYKSDIYAYEVWNILKDNKPVVYFDITPYFKAKINMMKAFESQWHFMYPLSIVVYFRARLYGMRNNCKYAEKFYKIK